ncbi:MAG: hypothetical protein HY435_00625 [Candidatus Liptonbacteria bacterium]|nr:hypothetical protein [Candidatus Liptonbacteria bacterium]
MKTTRQKTIYIAARFGEKDNVREIYERFTEKGHRVVGDWTNHKPIKPYQEHGELAREYAIEDIEAAANCDVFILLSSEAGTGMYIELGAAMAQKIAYGKPEIYVVGKHLNRSMFYFHPTVNRRQNIDEVIREL